MPKNKRMLSIDIGSKQVHAVVGSEKDRIVTVRSGYIQQMPPAAIADGRIVDPEGVRRMLTSFLKTERINADDVILTVQSTAAITRDIALPDVDPATLKEMIVYEMDQYLPNNEAGYSIETIATGYFVEDGVKKVRLRSTAMPNDMIQGYYDLVKALKLKPVALDIHSNAIQKLFTDTSQIEDNAPTQTADAYIDLGHASISINIISSKSQLEMSRIVIQNPRDLEDAISLYLSVPFEAVESVKKTDLDVMKVYNAAESDQVKSDTLRKVISQWSGDINRVFQYYQSRYIGVEIANCYLFGGNANIKGMVTYLGKTLNARNIAKLENAQRLRFERPGDLARIGELINAAAALIRISEDFKK